MNVSNPDNWILVWEGIYEQQPVQGTSNRFYPIGTISVPILLTSDYLLINTTSDNAPPNWKMAGYLRQAFDSPVIGAASAANHKSRDIFLNRLTIVDLPLLSPTYTVLIDVPDRIVDINFTIFQYESN